MPILLNFLGAEMLKFSLIAGVAALAFSLPAGAACLPESIVKAQEPSMNGYVHKLTDKNGAHVSIYQKNDAAANTPAEMFFEVIRNGACITSVGFLSSNELGEKYDLYGGWSEYEEGARGEGAGSEGGEMQGEVSDPYASEEEPAATKTFDAYPASKIYRGRIHLPDFKGRDKKHRLFRTRIIEGLKGGPKFAGEFAVIQFGCGSGCSNVLIASARTGQVFSFPRGGEDNQALEVRYQLNSKLMIANWCKDSAWSDCVEESLVFDNGKWVKKAMIPAASK